jgi:hypothetical protein
MKVLSVMAQEEEQRSCEENMMRKEDFRSRELRMFSKIQVRKQVTVSYSIILLRFARSRLMLNGIVATQVCRQTCARSAQIDRRTNSRTEEAGTGTRACSTARGAPARGEATERKSQRQRNDSQGQRH